jgi:hypothetical protein
MDKSKQSPSSKPKEVQVNVPSQLRAPAYANLVSMSAGDSEVTLNFIYVNPQDNPAGTLVSRVVVPRAMLGKMTDMLVQISEVAGRGDNK